MSWMDSWSRPSKHQATPAPFYLVPGGESTPYCHSCGRVISSRRTTTADKEVKYCSSRCRSHKPGNADRDIEKVFAAFLDGEIDTSSVGGDKDDERKPQKSKRAAAGAGKKPKGDHRILVSCDLVERHVFGPAPEAAAADDDDKSGTAAAGPAASEDGRDEVVRQIAQDLNHTGTLEVDEDPAAPHVDDGAVLARMSVRSGTRVRPAQSVSEVNGSVGGEKGRAERIDETEEMLEKRREGMRRVRHREMVRCAARRGVVFGFGERKCEAVMLGRVVEPSFAKGDWSIRWRE